MDIVVDTNVFINGMFKNDESCRAIFKLKAMNKVTFVMNQKMQAELLVTFANILLEAYDKKKDKNGSMKVIPLMASLSKCLWQVKEIDHIINTNYCEEDKSDNKFIDCCIDGDVKYLVTQDKHINSVSNKLKKERDIEVLSPFQFYTKYRMKQL